MHVLYSYTTLTFVEPIRVWLEINISEYKFRRHR